jgi:hypothetical protein
MRPWWLVVVAACGSDDPCDGVAATCVTVRVTSETVAAIDTLELDISYPGFHDTAATHTSGTIALPLATALELGDTPESITVGIVAAGKLAGTVLGTGYGEISLLELGAHATLDIPIALRADPCILGTYCGGNKLDGDPETLYLCHPGGLTDPDGDPEANVPTARGHCANGCIINSSDDDVCYGGNVRCAETKSYCGGDKLDGDPQWLYRCDAAGKGVFLEDCELTGKHCVAIAPDNDACR